MARIAGNTGVLNINAAVRLGATNIVWTPTRDLPDATGMDSGGYKQAVDGNLGATFSLTGHQDNTQVPLSVLTGGTLPIVLTIDNPVYRTFTAAACRLSSTPITVDVNGTTTYSVEGTIDGAWTEA